MQEASGFVLRLYTRAQGVSSAHSADALSGRHRMRSGQPEDFGTAFALSANKLSLQSVNDELKVITCRHKLKRLYGLYERFYLLKHVHVRL